MTKSEIKTGIDLSSTDISRIVISYLSMTKRLVDLDDAIEIKKVNFDPGVSQLEWEAIKARAPGSGKDQPRSLAIITGECLTTHALVYGLYHSDRWLATLSARTRL